MSKGYAPNASPASAIQRRRSSGGPVAANSHTSTGFPYACSSRYRGSNSSRKVAGRPAPRETSHSAKPSTVVPA